ncbi:di-trans,poly-cis-decaprenylcistransferase [Patescibacteria group bacterium]|nr:di-trans,poly-cis-decaprenylcistransferase [Patescibacteria group bacterium]
MIHSTRLNHLAIICDGNRRWAKSQGKPIFWGHQTGVKRIPELIDASLKNQIKYLTFWIFSTENWDRTQTEITSLFKLFKSSFRKFQKEAQKKQVRARFIGDTTKIPQDIQDIIRKIENETKDFDCLTVTFALNYGGRDELIRSIKKYSLAVEKGQEKIDDLTPNVFGRYLDTQGLPDPDLVVRTSGEHRLSGFLPWQTNYSELYFPSVHFPEFDATQLQLAVDEFNSRQRRFGK